MELNIGAYDPTQNYNIRRVSGGVESNLGTPIVTINEVTGKVTFTFAAAGLSIFILVEVPESNVTTDVFASLIAVDNLTRGGSATQTRLGHSLTQGQRSPEPTPLPSP